MTFEQLRSKLDLSRTQIAARLNTTAESVRQWEANLSVPSQTNAELASAYETTVPAIEKAVTSLVVAKRRRADLVSTK